MTVRKSSALAGRKEGAPLSDCGEALLVGFLRGKRERDAPSVDHLLVERAGHGREVEPVAICDLGAARRRPTPKKLPKTPPKSSRERKNAPVRLW